MKNSPLAALFFKTKNLPQIITLLFIGLLFPKNNIHAQPDINWLTTLGGSEIDYFSEVIVTDDGGYILGGTTESSDGDINSNNGAADFWLVKTDPAGNLLWEKTFGGSDGEYARTLKLTSDGGYIMAGSTRSSDGDINGTPNGEVDAWVIKLNGDGALEWEKIFGGSQNDFAIDLVTTTDDGYLIVGQTESNDGDIDNHLGGKDIWVLRLDNDGNIEWKKNYGGSADDYPLVVQSSPDGYVIGSTSWSEDGDASVHYGEQDFWIFQINTSGNIIWEKTLGGTHRDELVELQITNDGGLICAGYSESIDLQGGGNFGQYRNWVTKLANTGEIEWAENVEGAEVYGGFGDTKIMQLVDGKYIFLDYVGNLYQLDDIGNKEWEIKYEDSNYSTLHGFDLKVISDGSIVLVGLRTIDLGNGNFDWESFILKTMPLSITTTTCPDDLAGFTTIGEFNNSKYYISDQVARPTDAQLIAEANGGYLAVITSEEENIFVQQNISDMVYIGLNDETFEGNLTWVNGEDFNYDNINPCNFCNTNEEEQDFVIIQPWDGGWSFSNFYNQRKYIIEVPCGNSPPPTNSECTFKSNLPWFNYGTETTIETVETSNGYSLSYIEQGDVGIPFIIRSDLLLSNEGQYLNTPQTPFFNAPFGFTPFFISNNQFLVYAYLNTTNQLCALYLDGTLAYEIDLPYEHLPIPYLEIFESDTELLVMGTKAMGSSFSPFIKLVNKFFGGPIWEINLPSEIDPAMFGTPIRNNSGAYYIPYQAGYNDAKIMKINSNGNIEWEIPTNGFIPYNDVKIVGETPNEESLYYFIKNTPNPSIYKIDASSGALIWEKNLEIFLNPNEDFRPPYLESAVVTLDGGIVTGIPYKNPLNAAPDFVNGFNYGKLDTDGNVIWEHQWPLSLSSFTFQLATSDGGYLLTAPDNSVYGDYYAQKMTSQGLLEPSCQGFDSPDLDIQHIGGWYLSSTSTFEQGETITVEYDLQNVGLDTARGSYVIDFYISNNTVIDSNDVLALSVILSDTPTGEIDNLFADIQIPSNIPLGKYRLIAIIDEQDDIFEVNEHNNTYITSRVEIIAGTNTGNCPDDLPGFISLGEFNNSKYFLSEDIAQPQAANLIAIQNNGYLATITSQSENDFIANQLPEMAYIGLSDFDNEGNETWISGDPLSFTNFDICTFCNENTAENDFVVMHNWNGGWSWSSIWNARKYIVEIPCNVTLTAPNSQLTFSKNQNISKNVSLEKIYPNPTTQNIFVQIHSAQNITSNLQVLDARGQFLQNKTIFLTEGENIISLDLQQLPEGMYWINIPEITQLDASNRFIKTNSSN